MLRLTRQKKVESWGAGDDGDGVLHLDFLGITLPCRNVKGRFRGWKKQF